MHALDQFVPQTLGKSRSMSGSVVMSSDMKRSRVRSHLRGSTWLIPMRYPTSSATEEPRPRRGASPPPASPACQPALLHDALREKRDLPVEEQEARQVEVLDQLELLRKAGLDLRGDSRRTVAVAASRQSRSSKLWGV